jgi:hypothetical protein
MSANDDSSTWLDSGFLLADSDTNNSLIVCSNSVSLTKPYLIGSKILTAKSVTCSVSMMSLFNNLLMSKNDSKSTFVYLDFVSIPIAYMILSLIKGFVLCKFAQF